MKRITVWIDSRDDDVEKVCKRLEKFLTSVGLWHRIVDVCKLEWREDSK